MRLFVALWPPADVVAVLTELPRRDHPAVRWTTADQWHVTLRFLGDLPDGSVPEVMAGLDDLAREPIAEIVLGPRTTRLGRGQLVAPAAGAGPLAAAVAGITAGLGPEERHPFRGHLTLARARGRRAVPTTLAGAPIDARWWATEVALVRSHLETPGARYETIHRVPLG